MIRVNSSNLKAVEYDAAKRTLLIEFRNSRSRYLYKGVPKITYTNFMKSKSKGIFFATYIKNRYPFNKY